MARMTVAEQKSSAPESFSAKASAITPKNAEKVVTLQQAANKSAQTKNLSNLQNLANRAAPIQRMVLPVWNNNQDKLDFLDQARRQSTKLGDGQVIDTTNFLFNKNLSGLGETEDLHIIGHGNPATIAGKSPNDLATFIIGRRLPRAYHGHIFLEACRSGTDPAELEDFEELVGTYKDRFLAALSEARGEGAPQIEATGFDGTVVLDDTLPGNAKMRVVDPGVDFRQLAANALEEAEALVRAFADHIRHLGLAEYLRDELDGFIVNMYESRVGLVARVARGAPDKTREDIMEFKRVTLETLQARKEEFEKDAPEVLDMADLGLDLPPLVVGDAVSE